MITAEVAAPAQRWHRRKEARPGEILGAALACFAERGFAATRLDDVAQRAGITKGTLYLYFPNKEELFKAVVTQALVPNLERGEALLSEPGEPQPAAALLAQKPAVSIQRGPTPGQCGARKPCGDISRTSGIERY